MKTQQKGAAGVCVLLALVGLAGCAGSANRSAGVSNASTASPKEQSSQSQSARPLEKEATPQGKPKRCRSKGLKLEVVQPEGGAGAGSQYYQLKLTNISKESCNIYGFPGVSFTDAGGDQIGEPAKRQGDAKELITLQSGEHATSNLQIANAQNFEGCNPQKSVALKVYPPEERNALSTDFEVAVCSSEVVNASVAPVALSLIHISEPTRRS